MPDKSSEATFLKLIDTGASAATINPAPFKIVSKAYAFVVLGVPTNLYTAGVPLTAVRLVTSVPLLFDTLIFTVVVEFVAITISLASLKYCHGAGAIKCLV